MSKSNTPKPATPGQIKYGLGMEKRLGVPSVYDWERMTHKEAQARNGLLQALSKCISEERKTVLAVDDDGHMWWNYEPGWITKSLEDLI